MPILSKDPKPRPLGISKAPSRYGSETQQSLALGQEQCSGAIDHCSFLLPDNSTRDVLPSYMYIKTNAAATSEWTQHTHPRFSLRVSVRLSCLHPFITPAKTWWLRQPTQKKTKRQMRKERQSITICLRFGCKQLLILGWVLPSLQIIVNLHWETGRRSKVRVGGEGGSRSR